MTTKNKMLSIPVRILLGVVSVPSLYLAYMVGLMTFQGEAQNVDYFEWVYSLIGFIAMYMAISGKRLF